VRSSLGGVTEGGEIVLYSLRRCRTGVPQEDPAVASAGKNGQHILTKKEKGKDR